MKLIMAISKDGYVARHEMDTMDWLGSDDKAIFRILTSVGGEMFAGRRTVELMPMDLPGRTLHPLSRGNGGLKLENLRFKTMKASWLLGGQDIAMQALSMHLADSPYDNELLTWPPLIDEVHLCMSDRRAFPGDRRFTDRITPTLAANGMVAAMTTRFGDVRHHLYRLDRPLHGV